MALDVVVVGDLQLERALLIKNFGYQTALEYQLHPLKQQASWARANNVKRIVVVGDIFDMPHPQQSTITGFGDVLHQYSDLEWTILLGNHDTHTSNQHSLHIFDKIVQYGAMKHVNVVTKRLFQKWNDIPVNILSWPRKTPKYEQPSLIFAHITFKGSQNEQGQPLEGEKFPANKEWHWICGDVHVTQTPKPNLHYPGSPLQVTFADDLNRSWTLVSAKWKNDQLIVKHTLHPLRNQYRLIKSEISSRKELDALSKNPTDLHKIILVDWEPKSRYLDNRDNIISIERIGKTKQSKNNNTELDTFLDLKESVAYWVKQNSTGKLRKQTLKLVNRLRG